MADDDLRIPFPRTTNKVYKGAPKRPEHLKEHVRTIRMNNEDHDAVVKAAASIGMSFSELVKWCAAYGAIAVNNEMHRRQFDPTFKNTTPLTDYSDWK